LSGSAVTSNPVTEAVPEEGARSVVSMRIVVVFPAPFGPRSPNTSPVPTVKLTAFTAARLPKYFVRLLVLIMKKLRAKNFYHGQTVQVKVKVKVEV
jgi:hypothetical protein